MKKYLIIIILIALLFTALFSVGCKKQKEKDEVLQFMDEIYSINEEMWAEAESSDDLEEQIEIFGEALEELGSIYIPEPCEELFSKAMKRTMTNLDIFNELDLVLNSKEESPNKDRLNELQDKSSQLEIDFLIEFNRVAREYNIEIE